MVTIAKNEVESISLERVHRMPSKRPSSKSTISNIKVWLSWSQRMRMDFYEESQRWFSEGRIQNMDPRSMDHPCGPGPWTTSLDPVHGPLHGPPLILRDNAQGRRWVSECLSSQSFGFAGRRVIDLKCIYFSNAGICGADLPDSSDR